MVKRKFMRREFKIQQLGIADIQGDCFMPGCFEPKTVPLTDNFNKVKIIGQADIFEKDGYITGIAEIQDGLNGKYPAIGYMLKSFTIEPDKTKKISGIEIFSIGLCSSPNVDPNIEPI